MTARLTVVHCTINTAVMLACGWLRGAAYPAARSLPVSYLRETGPNPKAESCEPNGGAACGRAVGVGTGQMGMIRTHPPLKAVLRRSMGVTWLPLEKWEGFSAFAGVGHG